jgi:diketogulonate reductase-like aldo/keto reductase
MAVPNARLANGISIPVFGIGMDQVRDPQQAYDALSFALRIGYRSIDTASSYGNERDVGRAVKDSGIDRKDLYIATKVTGADQGYDATLRAFEKSSKLLGVDYLDGYLIHWPGKYMFVETWRALERLYREKRVRVIGVCNFNPHHIERLRREAEILPLVDQVEWHPYFDQPDLAAYCASHDIVIEAWSPLMCGGVVLEDHVIAGIASRIGKSPAQVILRWHLQGKRRIFPKSVTPGRIEENSRIFDFELSPADMSAIDALGGRQMRIGPNPDVFFDG